MALAKVISHIENRGPETDKVMAELYRKTGRALTVGITGPPGAGKSTIVDKLCALYVKRGQSARQAIIAGTLKIPTAEF